MGTRGTIPQPIHTLCAEAFDPFGDSLRRHVELTRGGGLAQPFFNNPPHHGLSTFGRQRSILVSVHSVPRESLFVWRHQRSRPGPNGQPPESSQLERLRAKWTPVRVRKTRQRLAVPLEARRPAPSFERSRWRRSSIEGGNALPPSLSE